MEYLLIIILILAVVYLYLERNKLQAKIDTLEKRLNVQFQESEHNPLSSIYVTPDVQHKVSLLKEAGKKEEAINLLKDKTPFDYIMAKKYIEHL